MKTWTALINPRAGNGRALRKWRLLAAGLENLGISFQYDISGHQGQISELAADMRMGGHTHFISVGGDGTHHDLINGLMSAWNPVQDPPVVAILSAGSGNDWARTHGITGDIRSCLQMILAENTILHPAGVITGPAIHRYFINVAGFALDGRVVETYPEIFRRLPFLPGYLLAGIKQLLFYRAKEISIQTDGHALSEKLFTVHAGLCKYSGGGMCFVPHADPALQDLAITCVQHMSRFRLLTNVYRVYTGSLLSHRRVKHFRGSSLAVTGWKVPVEADGEFVGYSPVEIRCIPNAFRLVVPE